MLQTQPSTKPANKNLSIAFANDNFCGNFFALFPNHFPSKTSKNNPHSLQNASPAFKNFKNSPYSLQNASSLSRSLRSLQSNSRLPLRRIASLAPEGVLAKNAVRVFFTPEPKNMILNVGNNLNVESKQTQEDSTSSGFGFNVGVGVGLERQSFSSDKTTQNGRFERTASLSDSETRVGGGVSVSGGFNISNSEMTRTWTDNITTLTATGAMVINTGTNAVNPITGENNKGDLNLTGAAILSDNMTLNIAGDINKTDLEDKYYSESMGFGLQVNNIGVGNVGGGGGAGSSGSENYAPPSSADATLDHSKQPFGAVLPADAVVPSPLNSGNRTNDGANSGATGAGQSKAIKDPKGSETISASYAENEASRTVYATIGGLNSKLVSETKTMIGADFEATLTIDNRLFSEAGRGEIKDDFKNLKLNTDIITDSIAQIPGSPMWASRTIDANNNEMKDGKLEDHPAPNLWFGLGAKPNTGLQSQECKSSILCGSLFSDSGLLRVLHDAIPGFRSSSAFHDSGKYPEWSTQITIPPYFAFNYYGAIGTMIDVRNWDKNFINSETNIFKDTFVNKPQNQNKK